MNRNTCPNRESNWLTHYCNFRQQSDTLKRMEQVQKDADYYHGEAESFRALYNEAVIDKQRLEQQLTTMRCLVDEERKEKADIRRQQVQF